MIKHIRKYRDWTKRNQRFKHLSLIFVVNRYEKRVNIIFSLMFAVVFYSGHSFILAAWLGLVLVPVVFLSYFYSAYSLYEYAKKKFQSLFDVAPSREDRFFIIVVLLSTAILLNFVYFSLLGCLLGKTFNS